MAETTAACPNKVGQLAESTRLNRATEALRTQDTFTREQVAWLMSQAMRWGYEARVDEENAAYPPAHVFTSGGWFDQAAERQKAALAARLPRAGDFQGLGDAQAEAPPLRVAA